VQPGDLWNVDLGEPVDASAPGPHLVLVVSPSRFTGPLRLVCPLTTTHRPYPWRVEIEPDSLNGLSRTSYVQTEHVRALSTSRATKRVGTLEDVQFLQVKSVLRLLLDL
jgi:mRNA interferase MazF